MRERLKSDAVVAVVVDVGAVGVKGRRLVLAMMTVLMSG